MLALATHYAKYGVYALPLAIAGAWFLHFPAMIGIPLALIGCVSVVLLYRASQATPPAAPPSSGGTSPQPPKTQ